MYMSRMVGSPIKDQRFLLAKWSLDWRKTVVGEEMSQPGKPLGSAEGDGHPRGQEPVMNAPEDGG